MVQGLREIRLLAPKEQSIGLERLCSPHETTPIVMTDFMPKVTEQRPIRGYYLEYVHNFLHHDPGVFSKSSRHQAITVFQYSRCSVNFVTCPERIPKL